MFLDASAIVAMMTREDGYEKFFGDVWVSKYSASSPIAEFEAALAISRKTEISKIVAIEKVSWFLQQLDVSMLDIPGNIGSTVVSAYDEFGRGSGHPAKLNMGDCFAYAMAKRHRLRLLYKGDDFAQTDLA